MVPILLVFAQVLPQGIPDSLYLVPIFFYMRGLKKKLLIENLTVEDLASEGKSFARYEGKVVFVAGCVPGDVIDVEITRNRERHMEGIAVRFHSFSPIRVEPFCRHFGDCGGCQWQQLPYGKQLEMKQKQVADQLERIARVHSASVSPILGAEPVTGYRNKLEYTFSNSRWLSHQEIESAHIIDDRRALGFHIPGRFDRVLDLTECHLQPNPSNQIRNFVRNFAVANNLSFYNLHDHSGLLRNLIIRTNQKGDCMVILAVGEENIPDTLQVLDAIHASFQEVTSLMYAVNLKANDTLTGVEVKLYKGSPFLEEQFDNLVFRISPKSFFQTNTRQALQLYEVTRRFAALTGGELVYDLYTGTGTIALFLARRALRVVGIEFAEDAIADARINASLNGIDNVSFFAGDMRTVLTNTFFEEHGRPDVVVTDPPRNGMHAEVIETILSMKPGRIVYVSCNPATQARDVSLLSGEYQVAAVQPVDMFPHTQHVENVILLNRLAE